MDSANPRIKGGIQEGFASVLQAYKSSDEYSESSQRSSVALQNRLLARRRRDQRASSADGVRADARIKGGTQSIPADVLHLIDLLMTTISCKQFSPKNETTPTDVAGHQERSTECCDIGW